MRRAKLTVRLPEENLEFARQFAARHGITVTEIIDRSLRSLKDAGREEISAAVRDISGLVPAKADADNDRRAHLESKHG